MSAAQKILAQVQEPLPSLEMVRPDAPPLLVEILNRMTAKNPDARFATAEAVAMALAPLATGASLRLFHGPAATTDSPPASESVVDATTAYRSQDSLRARRKFTALAMGAVALVLALATTVTWFRDLQIRGTGDESHTVESKSGGAADLSMGRDAKSVATLLNSRSNQGGRSPVKPARRRRYFSTAARHCVTTRRLRLQSAISMVMETSMYSSVDSEACPMC